MKFFEKIHKQAAVATGNFKSMFKDVEISPLPAATARLISELNSEEPDIRRLVKIISADLEISTRVMRTVNSSLYSLPHKSKSVHHAVTMLGIRRIQKIALSYAIMTKIPKPKGNLFQQKAFWTDSLLRALFARTLAHRYLPGEEDEAFTAILLSDVALPVLLCTWEEYYAPIVERWKTSSERLSVVERKDFGWDHAQAGAWILKSWNFPEELVCLVAVHNLSISDLQQLGLADTLAMPVAVASLLASVIRPAKEHAKELMETTCSMFSMSSLEFSDLASEVRENFLEICEQFGLSEDDTGELLRNLISIPSSQCAGSSAG